MNLSSPPAHLLLAISFGIFTIVGCDNSGNNSENESGPHELRIEHVARYQYENTFFYRIVPSRLSVRQAYTVENAAIGTSEGGFTAVDSETNVFLARDSTLAISLGAEELDDGDKFRTDTVRVFNVPESKLLAEINSDARDQAESILLGIEGKDLTVVHDTLMQ